MPHSSRLFLMVILLPSLVLAIMAVNLAREERVLVEHQQTVLYQTITDSLGTDINRELEAVRLEFKSVATPLTSPSSDITSAQGFDSRIRNSWPLAKVGFYIDEKGSVVSPRVFPGMDPDAATFLAQNRLFLKNSETADIYLFTSGRSQNSSDQTAQNQSVPMSQQILANQMQIQQSQRAVQPQRLPLENSLNLAASVPMESDFRKSLGAETSGLISRFLDNRLELLVWARTQPESDIIFGAEIDLERLKTRLATMVFPKSPAMTYLRSADGAASAESDDPGYCTAILNDRGEPIATSQPRFSGDWKRPFVSSEIGDALPHWEAALYLTHPDDINKSARFLQLILCIVIFVMFVAIAIGGSMIATDIRRQTVLAQQKTDFVSNVSHELKTPLTSIRMFSELLVEGRVADPERRLTYLKIISAEAARLTRLINNILDFAKPNRSADPGQFVETNVVQLLSEVVKITQPHLETVGVHLNLEIPKEWAPDAIFIRANPDSISQILLNLISNAEKYGGTEITVRISKAIAPETEATRKTGVKEEIVIQVLDRGPGVPSGSEERIFLPFVRLNDSLASGIPGTGLGLTLARRLAEENGGTLTYSKRKGGGSCFALSLPLNAVKTVNVGQQEGESL